MATPPKVDKPMPKQVAKSPDNLSVDEQTYKSILRLTTVQNVIALVVALFYYIVAPIPRSELWYCIPIIGLVVLGLTYNLIISRKWARGRSRLALNLAVLPSILAILIAAIYNGGVDSHWYMLWLIALVGSGITGMISVALASSITVVFYYVNFIFSAQAGKSLLGGPFEVVATIAAIVTATIIAREVDRMTRVTRFAEGLAKQLDSSELRDQLMMGAIADAVVAVDEKSKVVIFNEAAQEITGWDEKSARGMDFNAIVKLKDLEDADINPQNDPFQKVLKTNQPLVTNDFYMLNKQNKKINFSISIAPTMNSRGEVGGAIAVFHDISEQRAVARERNEFISTASHEMRTPVAAIEGYLSLAMNDNLATTDQRAKVFIQKAHDASLSLGRLFRDLLSVTRIEDNRIVINSRVFNLSELATQVVTELQIIAKKKEINILTHFRGDAFQGNLVVAPIYEVNADPDRVRECMANLIENSIKYSTQGTIDVSLKADKRFVTFSVKDQGIGISAESQKHLFQKFYRVNNNFTREVGGTGLGLYITRSLIEKFGGRIWVESEEGKGATFSFSLPLIHTS